MGRRAENTVRFADQSIRARIKDSTGQPQKEWRIEGVRGLVLITQPSGSGSFYAYYRNRLGKNRKLRLGEYPAITLQEARRKAEEARHDVEDGSDPVAEGQAKANAATFRELAELRLTEGDLAPRTVTLYRGLLRLAPTRRGNLKPFDFLELPAREVTPQMIVGAMDSVQRRNGATRRADMLRVAVSSVFAFGRGRKSVEANPAEGIAQRHAIGPRDRVPTEDELAKLWRATFAPKIGLSPGMRIIFRLAMLTGQRRAEIAGARRSELSLEGPAPVWLIPGDTTVRGRTARVVRGRTKNRKDQSVPLSPQTVALFREALALAGKGSEVVFPADLSKVKVGKDPKFPHLSPDAVSRAMIEARRQLGIEDITTHDMRRAVATWCGNTGVRPDVVDRILNHKPRDVTRMHYNHSTLDPLVRQALTAWANHIEALASGDTTGAGSNVVQLRASGAAA